MMQRAGAVHVPARCTCSCVVCRTALSISCTPSFGTGGASVPPPPSVPGSRSEKGDTTAGRVGAARRLSSSLEADSSLPLASRSLTLPLLLRLGPRLPLRLDPPPCTNESQYYKIKLDGQIGGVHNLLSASHTQRTVTQGDASCRALILKGRHHRHV